MGRMMLPSNVECRPSDQQAEARNRQGQRDREAEPPRLIALHRSQPPASGERWRTAHSRGVHAPG
jgi:hypothetical protein